MEKSQIMQPSKKLKIFFWVILGFISVFFAEVVSGSQMFPFFNIWGILVVIPLYTLHILVLSYIVFNYGKPQLYTLFIAGMIFGMYEAYLTKVLWNPTWGDPIISIGGISVIEFIVLVLFWHPFMSFIIPLFVSENILTNSKKIINGLPNRIKLALNADKRNYILILLIVLFLGMSQSTNSPSPLHSLLSGLSTGLVLVIPIYFFRNKTKANEYDIKQFLPNKKEFSILLTFLIFMYVFMAINIRPEALPGFGPQLIIWVIYLILFLLLILTLRKSNKDILSQNPENIIKFSQRAYVSLFLLFIFSSVVSKLLLGSFGGIIMLVFWVVWCFIGLAALYKSIRYLME